MLAKNTTKKRETIRKYKNIPAALSPLQIEEIDAIAKVENMTRFRNHSPGRRIICPSTTEPTTSIKDNFNLRNE